MRQEDEEHTLVFIDMLGFAALTKRLEKRVLEERNEERGPSADEQDQELFAAVTEMKDPAIPLAVRRQYTETLKALNRMRKARGRKPVSGRSKRK